LQPIQLVDESIEIKLEPTKMGIIELPRYSFEIESTLSDSVEFAPLLKETFPFVCATTRVIWQLMNEVCFSSVARNLTELIDYVCRREAC